MGGGGRNIYIYIDRLMSNDKYVYAIVFSYLIQYLYIPIVFLYLSQYLYIPIVFLYLS